MFSAHKKIHGPDVTIDGKDRGLPLWQLMCQFFGDAAEVKQRWLLWKSKVFCRFLAWPIDLPQNSQFLTAESAMHKNDSARRLKGRHAWRSRGGRSLFFG
jgi:hypothetical protein